MPAAAQDQPPCAPAGFRADPLGVVIHLTWTDQADATGYRIYRTPSQPDPQPAILMQAPSNETFDTQVEQGVTYTYRITSVVGDVESLDCGSVTVRANSDPCAPTAMADHRGDSVHIEWTGVVLADEYRVYRAGDDGVFVLISTVPSVSQAYDGPLGQHESASYQVHAVIDGGERPACNTVVVASISVPMFGSPVAWGLAGAGVLAAGLVLRRKR